MHRSHSLQLPVLLLLLLPLLFLVRQSLLGLHCAGAAADGLLLLLLCRLGHLLLQSAAPRGLLQARCPPLSAQTVAGYNIRKTQQHKQQR
jgi:hypothetical protein